MSRYVSIGSDPYVLQVVSDQTNEVIVPVIFDAAAETLTAAAPAVSLDCYKTVLDATSNGVAATLADGNVHGQMKEVQASVVTGGAVTLTIASPVSAALDVVTFSLIGDTVTLIWSETGAYWRILSIQDTDRDYDTPVVA
jgi:hypothetical protein